MESSKLKWALDAAANGFRVFPIEPNTKRPKAGLPWKAAATSDPAEIETWWAENPDYNIGVAAGQGLLVVDADTKDGKPGLDSLAMLDMTGLPQSLRVATPSGGVHVYLRSVKQHRNRVDSLPNYPGIDIRSDAGYVLGPGSTLDGKAYTPLSEVPPHISDSPDWFDADLANAPQHRMASTAQPLVDLDRPENVARATSWLTDTAPEALQGAGGDDTTYRVACKLRDFGLAEATAFDMLLEHWNETKAIPPWAPDELEKKVANAFDFASGGWGAGTAAGEFGVVDIEIGEPPVLFFKSDEGEILENPNPRKSLSAKPYIFVDAAAIPKREWIGGRHLIRKFVSMTIAPGNIGKSSLVIAELLALASGKPILGHAIERPYAVWYWNLEDPYDELQRRVQAAMQHYGLTPEDIGGRLFVNSGRDDPLRIAIADKNGARIVRPIVDAFTAEMIARQIDVVSIDPFVSSHGVPENDNLGMDMVSKEWGRVADRANAAIDLVHHTRKASGADVEVTTESARGGKALSDAARDVRVLNRMARDEAEKAGIENHRLYFRTYSDKANMAPPADHSEWFKLESVALANGDDVGVVVPWQWPDPFADVTADHVRRVQAALRDKEYAANIRAKDWVGFLVANVVGMNLEVASEKEKVRLMVAEWLAKGWLKKVRRPGENRHEKDFVEAGNALQEDFAESALVEQND